MSISAPPLHIHATECSSVSSAWQSRRMLEAGGMRRWSGQPSRTAALRVPLAQLLGILLVVPSQNYMLKSKDFLSAAFWDLWIKKIASFVFSVFCIFCLSRLFSASFFLFCGYCRLVNVYLQACCRGAVSLLQPSGGRCPKLGIVTTHFIFWIKVLL